MSATAAVFPCYSVASKKNRESLLPLNPVPLKLGLMIHNVGKHWHIETLIKNCAETGFKDIELRTTLKSCLSTAEVNGERFYYWSSSIFLSIQTPLSVSAMLVAIKLILSKMVLRRHHDLPQTLQDDIARVIAGNDLALLIRV